MLKIKTIFSRPKSQILAIASAIAIFFFLDRYFKIIALSTKTVSSEIIKDVLNFKFTANYHAAFSIPLNENFLYFSIGVIIVALLAYIIYLKNTQTNTTDVALLSLILAGAISNYYDRLLYGYVIDYWALKYFTVFNLADVMISFGAAWLILRALKK